MRTLNEQITGKDCAGQVNISNVVRDFTQNLTSLIKFNYQSPVSAVCN